MKLVLVLDLIFLARLQSFSETMSKPYWNLLSIQIRKSQIQDFLNPSVYCWEIYMISLWKNTFGSTILVWMRGWWLEAFLEMIGWCLDSSLVMTDWCFLKPFFSFHWVSFSFSCWNILFIYWYVIVWLHFCPELEILISENCMNGIANWTTLAKTRERNSNTKKRFNKI